jgi:hypothetical protein
MKPSSQSLVSAGDGSSLARFIGTLDRLIAGGSSVIVSSYNPAAEDGAD